MPRPRKPLHKLAPSAFTKNAKRNEAMGRFNVPQYPVLVMGEPPETLQHDELAQKYWRGIAPLLNQNRVVTLADVNALTVYCQTLADVERDTAQIALEGRTVMDDKGVIREHPLLKRLHSNRCSSIAIGKEYGLTSASRTKAATVPDEDEITNEFEED